MKNTGPIIRGERNIREAFVQHYEEKFLERIDRKSIAQALTQFLYLATIKSRHSGILFLSDID